MGTFARDSRRVAPVFPNPGVRNLPFQKPYSGAYLTLQVLHFLQKCAIARLIPRVHTHSRPSPGRSPGGRTLVCVLMCVCVVNVPVPVPCAVSDRGARSLRSLRPSVINPGPWRAGSAASRLRRPRAFVHPGPRFRRCGAGAPVATRVLGCSRPQAGRLAAKSPRLPLRSPGPGALCRPSRSPSRPGPAALVEQPAAAQPTPPFVQVRAARHPGNTPQTRSKRF